MKSLKKPKLIVIDGVNFRIENFTKNDDYILLKKAKPDKMVIETIVEYKIVEEDLISLDDIYNHYKLVSDDKRIPVYIYHYIAVRLKGFTNKEVSEKFNTSKSAIARNTAKRNIRLRAEEVLVKIKNWKYEQLNGQNESKN